MSEGWNVGRAKESYLAALRALRCIVVLLVRTSTHTARACARVHMYAPTCMNMYLYGLHESSLVESSLVSLVQCVTRLALFPLALSSKKPHSLEEGGCSHHT